MTNLTCSQSSKYTPNCDDALKYFNTLAPSVEHFDLRLIMDNGNNVKTLPNFKANEQSLKQLMEHNRNGFAIYAAVNQTNGHGVTTKHITQVRALFVDFDDPERDNLAVINSMKLTPNMVIETSRNKYHAYWFINDCLLSDFKKTQLALSHKFNSDPSVNDLARIMRVPGFYHQKDEPFYTRIISTCDKQYCYQDVTSLLDLDFDAIDNKYASYNQGNSPDDFNDGSRFEVFVELDSAQGDQLLDDLYATNGPMQYLLNKGYGTEQHEFVRLSANHQPFIGTVHEERALELLDSHLSQVGGNYNADENELRLRTFSQGHPSTMFIIAQELGWLNPNKIYSSGFSIRDDAIYKLSSPDKNGECTVQRISSWIIVLARTRGLTGYNHGYLLQWKDKDGHIKEKAIPASALHDSAPLIETLTNSGLSIVPGKIREFLTYVEGFKAETVVDCANQTGWYDDNSFILPTQSFRPDNNKTRLLLQGAGTVKNITCVNGSLSDWQINIGRKCVGNSRLALGVSVALAAPLLKMLKIENGGFHLVGDSSLGKSTALKVAASIYGSPDYMKTWKSTDTALEYIAAAYNDMLLPLDELKQAAPETISSAIYMLANGRGKERGKKDGGVRAVTEWQTLVLSSGERTPAELLHERGGIHAGQEVRLINIPADTGKHGLFETLHDTGSGEHLSNTLVTNAANYYGSAGEAWLQHLVNERDSVIKSANKLIASFTDNTTSDKFDGQLKRVLSKFALLAAAGELATTANITGWRSGEATKALMKTFNDYLNARGGTGKNEDHDIIDKVRASLMSHGNARFENVSDISDRHYKTQNQLGYKIRVDNQTEYIDDFANYNDSYDKDTDVKYYHLVSNQSLTKLAAGYSANKIASVLYQRGYLITSQDRKQRKWNPSNIRRPMQGSWFYTIKPEIFDEGDE